MSVGVRVELQVIIVAIGVASMPMDMSSLLIVGDEQGACPGWSPRTTGNRDRVPRRPEQADRIDAPTTTVAISLRVASTVQRRRSTILRRTLISIAVVIARLKTNGRAQCGLDSEWKWRSYPFMKVHLADHP
jgi:hypothetical protein